MSKVKEAMMDLEEVLSPLQLSLVGTIQEMALSKYLEFKNEGIPEAEALALVRLWVKGSTSQLKF